MSGTKLNILRRRINICLGLSLTIMVCLAITFIYGYSHQKILEKASENRHFSYLLADQLRQSSDDLTRMVRMYSVTGDTLYKNQFFQVLKIRKGLQKRPDNYHRIYWNFMIDKNSVPPSDNLDSIALDELFRKAGFTKEELLLLYKAEKLSDELVELEVQSFNAMEGKFKDSNGLYTVLKKPDYHFAIEIVHGEKYNKAKAGIMLPINEFYSLLDKRTKKAVDKEENIVQKVIVSLIVEVLFATFLMVFLLYTGKKYYLEIVNYLKEEVEIKTNELALSQKSLEQKNKELIRSNNELQHFAYVASHDLQEPLRMVSSYTALLERRYSDKLDQPAKDFIHFAVDGAERMQTLINDLLQYSRVTTKGKEFEEFFLHDAYQNALENIKMKITESQAQIATINFPTVRGDIGQITRLFQNLITNAINYRSIDSPVIKIDCVETGSEIRISVKDNGIGIDQKFHERIFKIFQRLHSRETHAGTGIGLAICRKIVERHGGTIWVESKLGEGSTFCFTLPKGV